MTTNPRPIPRRRFLKTSLAACLGGSAAVACAKEPEVKIDRIEAFPVRYPVKGYFKFFESPHGAYGRAAVMVKITSNTGLVGWGQSVPVETWAYETLEAATIAIRDYYTPSLLGHDPRDIAGAHALMDLAIRPAFATGMPITRAGIDIALHDLAGKLAGKSIAQLWGRAPGEPITLSWTVNARSIDEVDALIDAGRKSGYRNFNIKVAPDVEFDVALARRVRKLVPNGFLWADANGGYDPRAALEAAPKLADAGVDVLESPVRPNHLSAYRALKRQGALPILMDEGVISPVELQEFIRLKMLDGVAMKPSRCGGLMSARRQIEILEDAGLIWLGSGLCDPDISLAATLCLFATYGMKKPAALNGPQFLTAQVLKTPLKITGDIAQVPSGPGLGIEVDEEKVRVLVERTRQKN